MILVPKKKKKFHYQQAIDKCNRSNVLMILYKNNEDEMSCLPISSLLFFFVF